MRLIDADALVRKYLDGVERRNKENTIASRLTSNVMMIVINDIKKQTTVDCEKHGKWKRCGVVAHCSNCLCGTIYPTDRDIDFEYCPHCGAIMDGATDATD